MPGRGCLVFPTSQGRFYEYEDRGMVAALGDFLEKGWLQLYCVDSVDAESFYCRWAHPAGRIIRHLQYEDYLLNEVLPLSRAKNANPFLIAPRVQLWRLSCAQYCLSPPAFLWPGVGVEWQV